MKLAVAGVSMARPAMVFIYKGSTTYTIFFTNSMVLEVVKGSGGGPGGEFNEKIDVR